MSDDINRFQVKIIGGHGGSSPGYKATSYLINNELLIDAGSIATGLPEKEQRLVDNILISHAHLDHINELAFLCDNCFGTRDKPFQVYANKTVIKAIRDHLLNDIIWPDFTSLPNPENPTVHLNEIEAEKVLKIGGYEIFPVRVNHFTDAFGYIIRFMGKSIIFTQDTGPTDRIWEIGKEETNLVAIFCEVSFPNHMEQVAKDSLHHTPKTITEEIKKMPKEVPIYLGHIKPKFQDVIVKEMKDIAKGRVALLENDGVLLEF